jgi:hypothetical protein
MNSIRTCSSSREQPRAAPTKGLRHFGLVEKLRIVKTQFARCDGVRHLIQRQRRRQRWCVKIEGDRRGHQ